MLLTFSEQFNSIHFNVKLKAGLHQHNSLSKVFRCFDNELAVSFVVYCFLQVDVDHSVEDALVSKRAHVRIKF